MCVGKGIRVAVYILVRELGPLGGGVCSSLM